MKKIKVIIFDLDGTLINAYGAVTQSMNYTLERMGIATTDEATVRRNVGWGEKSFFLSFVEDKDFEKAKDLYRKHCRENLYKYVKFMPGSKELLESLKKKGFALAVATNRPRYSSNIILEHLEIKDCFDYIVCGDEIEKLKPEPDILIKVLNNFSIEPDEALYVGDMTVDIETGKKANVKVVAVTTGSSYKNEIEEAGPCEIIDNICELERLEFLSV